MRNFEMADPEMVAECFLGLRVPRGGMILERLPGKARLELWPAVVEPAVLEWVAPVLVTSASPLDVSLVSVSPEAVKQLHRPREPEPQPTPQLRRATEADLDAGIRWSAAQSKDGRTSGRQLRSDAPKWCNANGVEYSNREDWERRLEEHPGLMRGIGKHGSPVD
jgi:hypothetical protein